MTYRVFGLAICAGLVPIIPGTAGAQGAADALEEVTVTAQRREQNIMDVPISIDVVQGEEILFRGIEDVQRLSEEVPSLVVGGQGQTFGGVSLSIRGVGSQLGDTAVGFYIDEIFQANTSGFVSQFIDVERVEVLKGPQGTLWGRNNTGGTIHYVTKAPQLDDLSFEAYTEVGTYSSLSASDLPIFKLGASTNIPLGDKAALRLSAAKVQQDNYTFNLQKNSPEPNQNATTFRARLLFEPLDNLSVDLGFSYVDDPSHNSFLFKTRPFENSAALFIVDLLDDIDIEPDPYQVRSDVLNPIADFEELGGRLDVQWDINEQWGFRSLTAYKDLEMVRFADLDVLQVELVHNNSQQKHYWLSEELQLQYNTDRLNVIGGVYYFKEERTEDAQTSANTSLFFTAQCNSHNPSALLPVAGLCGFVNPIILPTAQAFAGGSLSSTDFVPGGAWDQAVSFVEVIAMLPPGTLAAFNSLPFGFTVSGSDRRYQTESLAFFAQGTYELTDALSLTLGLRHTEDDKQIDVTTFAFGAISGTPSIDETFSATTPKIGLEWRPNDDMMAYFSITQGFKSGTLNQFADTVAGELPDVAPEEITAFEAGLKGVFADGLIAFDGAAFVYDYEDYQLQVQFAEGPRLFNLAAVDIVGAEGALTLHPKDNFEFGISASYVDSEVATDVIAVDPFDVAAGPQNLRGQSLPRTPKWKGTIWTNVDWDTPVGPMTASLNYNYSGEFANDPFGQFLGADYSTVNLGLRLVDDEGRWWANLYARNLTDETYTTASLFTDSIGEVQFFAPPRTTGLQFGINF